MDQNSLALVTRSLADRVDAIRRLQPAGIDGRGRAVVLLVEAMLEAVELERDRVLGLLDATSGDEAQVLARRLLRLLAQVTSFSTLTPFLADAGRRDLPIGLLQAVDILVEALLPEGADPVVHLDEHHMYSTLDLLAVAKPTLTALGRDLDIDTTPLVLFVPGIDPSNALLMPILAHEVGHAAVEQATLGSTVLTTADLDPLNSLLDECLREAGDPEPGPWQVQLFGWIDELLCDALALALTGPSFLFAASVFLPAPQAGTVGSHPFPSDRIGFALRALAELGWEPLLQSQAPIVRSWLTTIGQGTGPATEPRERFLREGLKTLESAILKVAVDHVTGGLTPQVFDNFDSRVGQLLDLRIPPAQVGVEAVPAWVIVLAAWLFRLRQDGDNAEALAAASSDQSFNQYVLKSIEMSRILSLWNMA